MLDNNEQYIIVSDTLTLPYPTLNNLGHEIFCTRKIVLILLYNNIINSNAIIVTSYTDRFFLYTNYFKKAITYEDYLLIQDKSNTINLSPLLLVGNIINKKGTDELIKLGLVEEFYDNKIFNNIHTPDFNKYICNLEFCDLTEFEDIINQSFIVIHIRPTSTKTEFLLELIEYCKTQTNLNCIVFTNIKNFNYSHQTNNLQKYASLMNHKNCECLITEWSGGGQLSQFCCKKVLYYFDKYSAIYTNDDIPAYKNRNDNCFHINWDHYTPFNCKRHFIVEPELSKIQILNYVTEDNNTTN